jgi:hypothetical protein
MQVQSSTSKDLMPIARKQLVERLGNDLRLTESTQRNGNMLRSNIHAPTQSYRKLQLSTIQETADDDDFDADDFVDAASGPGRFVVQIPAHANAHRAHRVISDDDEGSEHSAHHDAVFPYVDDCRGGEHTQQMVVIFVEQLALDQPRLSWQAFYNSHDRELLDPVAIAIEERRLAGDAAVSMI